MKKKKIEFNKKCQALFQIFVFIISIFAFAYLISGEIGFVGAQNLDIPQAPPAGVGGTTATAIANAITTSEISMPLPVAPDVVPKEIEIPGLNLNAPKPTPGFDALNPTKISIIDAAIRTLAIGFIVFSWNWLISGGNTEDALFWTQATAGAWGTGEAAQLVTTWVAENWLGLAGTDWVPGLGVGVRVVATLYTFWKLSRRADSKAVLFECRAWQSKTKGEDCDLCNHQEFACTEYQCKSLGQGCNLTNADTSTPRCIWTDQDKTPPKITPWNETLTPGYYYERISEKAYNIKYTEKECLPAFQIFTFGVTLNKLGACKIEEGVPGDFSKMELFMNGDSSFQENHSQTFVFPGSAYLVENGIEVKNNGNYEYYIRCSNVNGNTNDDEFLFKFCIEEGPDNTQPIIKGFNLLDNTPITYFDENTPHEIAIKAHTNKPADCSWDVVDRDYKDMTNILTCPKIMNTQTTYTCSGTLNGLENEKANKFYFRCNDTSGNMMTESKTLTLLGTKPLKIDSIEPTEGTIIKGASNKIETTLKARTSGYKNGEAICFYSTTGNYNEFSKFDNTQSYQSSHVLSLASGNYHYYIKCVDIGGNIAQKETTFSIETDFTAPVIVRAYNDNGKLKIITNENSSCVYNTNNNIGCGYNFEDGLKFTTTDNIAHSIAWDTKNNFYIICKDNYGIYPHGDCSIRIRPFQSY